MTVLRYKGYTAQLDVDVKVGVVSGRVQDIKTVIVFESADIKCIQQAFEAAIDDYLEDCTEQGEEPERPYSGSIFVRTSPEIHRHVAEAAQRAGQSINTWAERALKDAACLEGAASR
jgi:predicted HicB family RNase H-like nuclease